MKKIVVLISGGGTNLEAIAKACQSGNIEGSIELVISNEPKAQGLERAKKYHLMTEVLDHSLFDSREVFDEALIQMVLSAEPDLVILAGFMRVLSSTFTSQLEGKLVNIHPSLLPEYPGLGTHKQAMNNGDLMHGVTVHFVDEGVDTGPIIAQAALKIEPDQTEKKLISRIHKIEHAIFPKVIGDISKDLIQLQSGKVLYSKKSYFRPNHMEFHNV